MSGAIDVCAMHEFCSVSCLELIVVIRLSRLFAWFVVALFPRVGRSDSARSCGKEIPGPRQGGLLMSKPTWSNSSGCSTTSAFFVVQTMHGRFLFLTHGGETMLLLAATAEAHRGGSKVVTKPCRAQNSTKRIGSLRLSVRGIRFRALTKRRLPGTTSTSRQTSCFRLRPTTPNR